MKKKSKTNHSRRGNKQHQPPFKTIVFGKFYVVPSFDAESTHEWYITVLHKPSGRHLHFEYSDYKSVKSAIMLAKRAHQGYTPSYYSVESKRSIIYLSVGGDKPSDVRRKNQKVL